ncbi:MAG: SDR family oxidoreductase, partial [Acidimicrobiia bacterium]|nr:SDR family oxidoreductase [Acidimicrobiia bacterium]
MSGVIVVTGASRGIGAATARLAAARGFGVCVNYHRSVYAAGEVVADCREAGVGAVAVAGDMAVEGDVVALFETAEAELGPVTGLVNNAGIVAPQARLDSYSRERLEEMMAVNVIGPFLCAREAVKRMSTRYGGAGGSIVNVSSAAALLGSPNEFIDYAASKGALDSMTIGLAKEVAAEGIRVNAVRPGLIYTDIHASAGAPDRVEQLVGGVPMGRGGTAGEVAEAVLWLLSPAAGYVTGAF